EGGPGSLSLSFDAEEAQATDWITSLPARGDEHGNLCAGAWGMAWGLVLAETHPLLGNCWPRDPCTHPHWPGRACSRAFTRGRIRYPYPGYRRLAGGKESAWCHPGGSQLCGMVITGVVDQVPERIADLVYLDTFVPRDGESMAGISRIVTWILRKQTRADGWRVDSRGTYGVTTEPDRSWVLSKVTPHPLKTLEQPLHLKNPAIVSAKPRTHIACTGGFFFSLMERILAHILAPRALPPREAGWRLRQLRSGHDAMITKPRELA